MKKIANKFNYVISDKDSTVRDWAKTLTNREYADFSNVDLSGVNLSSLGDKLNDADFYKCNLTGAKLKNTQLHEAKFSYANLTDADLEGSDCNSASFFEANVNKCNFHDANIGGANFHSCKNLTNAKGLEFSQMHSIARIDDLDKIDIPWYDKYLSWEYIRGAGKLPIFGASYISLVFIPIFFYIIALYNNNLEKAVEFSDVIMSDSEEATLLKYENWKNSIHPVNLPAKSVVFYFGTLLLAIASTIFALACPDRIKNFSREEWIYGNHQHEIYYSSLAWKKRTLRVICSFSYVIGGGMVLFFILNKLLNAGIFIISNS